jgi:hypothetical protein
MEMLECPEWIHIPMKYKLLLGFKWEVKGMFINYTWIPSDWKEEWEKMKEVIGNDLYPYDSYK